MYVNILRLTYLRCVMYQQQQGNRELHLVGGLKTMG